MPRAERQACAVVARAPGPVRLERREEVAMRLKVTIHGFREFREMTRFPHRLVVYRAAWTTRTFGYNNWSAKTSA
jgi:hypothetical protein